MTPKGDGSVLLWVLYAMIFIHTETDDNSEGSLSDTLAGGYVQLEHQLNMKCLLAADCEAVNCSSKRIYWKHPGSFTLFCFFVYL